MNKAYDPKDLVRRLKENGLNVAEDAAKVIVEQTFGWVEDSAKLSTKGIIGKLDDVVVSLLPPLKSFILEQVDKIDGEQG